MRNESVCILGLLLLLSGCAHGPLTLSPEALAAFTQQDHLKLRSSEGKKVRLGGRSSLQFRRRDGTLTPWVEAGKLYANSEGIVAWHRASLEDVQAIYIKGMHPLAKEALEELVPPTQRRAGPSDSIALLLPGDQIEAFMGRLFFRAGRRWAPADLAQAPSSCPQPRSAGDIPGAPGSPPATSRSAQGEIDWDAWRKGKAPPDLACREELELIDYRVRKYLRQSLLGAPLGRWYFQTRPYGVQGPFEGEAIFIAYDEGVGIPDGLRWSDMKDVSVRRAPILDSEARAMLAKIGVAIALLPLILVTETLHSTAQSFKPEHLFEAAVGLPVTIPPSELSQSLGGLVEKAGQAAARTSSPPSEPSTGTTLARKGLKLPDISGAQPLLKGRPISPWSPEALVLTR